MKKISLFLVFIFSIVLACTQNYKNKADNSGNIETKCEKYAYFGDTKICLPEIDGMTECYSNPNVKKRSDRIFLSNQKVLILASYIPNEIYKKIDILDEISFSEYFIIYGYEYTKNVKIGIKDLNEANQAAKDAFGKIELNFNFDKTWNIDDILMNFGKPVLLENYVPNNNTRTFVLLMYMKADNKEFIMLSLIDMMLVKENLIILNYFYTYDGKESIAKAKSKNNNVILRFLEENN